MTDINTIFKLISIPEREHLMTGFEANFADTFVEWAPGRFLGVNITRPDLQIEQQSGYWTEGAITSHLIPFKPIDPEPEPKPEPEPEQSYAFRPFTEEVG